MIKVTKTVDFQILTQRGFHLWPWAIYSFDHYHFKTSFRLKLLGQSKVNCMLNKHGSIFVTFFKVSFYFGFGSRILFLIAPVPYHCLLVTVFSSP